MTDTVEATVVAVVCSDCGVPALNLAGHQRWYHPTGGDSTTQRIDLSDGDPEQVRVWAEGLRRGQMRALERKQSASRRWMQDSAALLRDFLSWWGWWKSKNPHRTAATGRRAAWYRRLNKAKFLSEEWHQLADNPPTRNPE